MFLNVEYYRIEDGASVKCWSLLPLTQDLDEAIAFAHTGFEGVKTCLGATAFRVVDSHNRVLASVNSRRGNGNSRHAGSLQLARA
jgi:hypothetical protein